MYITIILELLTQNAFIFIDFMAFLFTVLLLLRIGSGLLSIPVFFFALSFLIPPLTFVIFGESVIWVLPVIQTLIGLIGIALLMKILGVFELISSTPKK
ncbi:hypothetical protein COV24_01710 [candidate division WWE3 bacterium CG10_big_fil_rev_8_21_14_0_10_32_10]|uniref:Uncharacterized protein n=1 Tax=candidate division WWE3 bacterium CG10_big_fil_rev_8_21_14_0_10_32_10 TaxID=1975090 RepID=A0A2H0RB83_UNCKA|nr:MAG: hypothetical protein COV24_01710 [candidate division WWE3 bacterium CG10_big_fil_rev_8_21_14_0_10_32_10]